MIPWLDSSEEVSRYLRGSISYDVPAVPKSESFFVLLLLLVICGFLASALIVGIVHLWQGRLAIGSKAIKGPVHRGRLKRRISAVATAPRERIEGEAAEAPFLSTRNSSGASA
jgi:hypothetical protein